MATIQFLCKSREYVLERLDAVVLEMVVAERVEEWTILVQVLDDQIVQVGVELLASVGGEVEAAAVDDGFEQRHELRVVLADLRLHLRAECLAFLGVLVLVLN